MNRSGKTGCGCLITLLIICMILIGLAVHPLSLKSIAGQFRYEDKIFSSDIIFVPRFCEDKGGELYEAAFGEYRAGNGKTIWIEDEKVFGASIVEFVGRLGKARGVREEALKRVELSGSERVKAAAAREKFIASGAKKVILVVPEYASRYYHLLYGGSDGDDLSVLIKPVKTSYFKRESWWKDGTSRLLLIETLSSVGAYYLDRFKYGELKKKITG